LLGVFVLGEAEGVHVDAVTITGMSKSCASFASPESGSARMRKLVGPSLWDWRKG
jgi:hypothetical protein